VTRRKCYQMQQIQLTKYPFERIARLAFRAAERRTIPPLADHTNSPPPPPFPPRQCSWYSVLAWEIELISATCTYDRTGCSSLAFPVRVYGRVCVLQLARRNADEAFCVFRFRRLAFIPDLVRHLVSIAWPIRGGQLVVCNAVSLQPDLRDAVTRGHF